MSAAPPSNARAIFQSQVAPRPIRSRLLISISVHVAVLSVICLVRPVAQLEVSRQSAVLLLAPPPHLSEPPLIAEIKQPKVAVLRQFDLAEPFVETLEPARNVVAELTPQLHVEAPTPEVIPTFEPPPLAPPPLPPAVEKRAGFQVAAAAHRVRRPNPAVAGAGFSSSDTRAAAGKPAAVAWTGGFGAAANISSGRSDGAVRSESRGGFGAVRRQQQARRTLKSHKNPLISTTNVQILSKPRPRYTDVAQDLKIEGSVVFDVVFQADGRVRILRLLEGLGHGLDETAREAALAIRFKPSLQDGQPVDVTARVSILFRIAY